MRVEPVSFSQPVSSVSRVGKVNFRQLKKLDTLTEIDAAIKTELRQVNPDVERLQFLKDKKEILEKYSNPNRLSFAELLGIEMAGSVKPSASEKITMPQFAYQATPTNIKETLRVSYSIINRIMDSQKLAVKNTANTNTNYAMAYGIIKTVSPSKTSASEKIAMPQFAYQAEPTNIKETLRVSYSIINRIMDSQKLAVKNTANTNTNYAMAYAI